ncbi:M50 family metallopeptidase [Candidatus Woesearchaeota archaeon]|nr:M50 family metallopeptidase [Candidatus Woesearchaeota archaeon]
MPIITPKEILDVVIMTLALGFIFKDAFTRRHDDNYDPLLHYQGGSKRGLGPLFEACIITAPAIVLHEAAHKIVALMAGLEATFHASYGGLGLGVLLKALGSPFIFFVPGYVSIFGGTNITAALTSVAGPLINGALYLLAYLVIMYYSKMRVQTHHRLVLTRKINGFLFIFNMLPIPGFDGFTFFSSVLKIV